jgi:hypothetical protein
VTSNVGSASGRNVMLALRVVIVDRGIAIVGGAQLRTRRMPT